ncbi:MAG: hypothetical protein LH610_10460 [Sphingomonas bacterium]|nr:hypothetical protein [Sphingomonas bacterium]
MAGTARTPVRLSVMENDEVYDEAGKVSAEDGIIHLDGPNSVDVRLTADAAEEISDQLLNGALKARGQIFFANKKARRV